MGRPTTYTGSAHRACAWLVRPVANPRSAGRTETETQLIRQLQLIQNTAAAGVLNDTKELEHITPVQQIYTQASFLSNNSFQNAVGL